MANTATKGQLGQSLVAMISAMAGLSVLLLAGASVPLIMRRSATLGSAENANQTLGLALQHVGNMPEVCNQALGGLMLPQVGTPLQLPSISLGPAGVLNLNQTFLGVVITEIRLDRFTVGSPGANKDMVRVGIRSQRPGSTDTYWSEVMIPVNTINNNVVQSCIVAISNGSGGPTVSNQLACESMGGIWRSPSLNYVVTACDPGSAADFAGGLGCPLDPVTNQPMPFMVNLPIALADTLTGEWGACDMVAGLCAKIGARIKRVVPPIPGEGNPYSPPPYDQPNNAASVPPDLYWGFALECDASDFDASFFQVAVGDGGCLDNLYVTGFGPDGTLRCTGTNPTATCPTPGRCIRPALLQNRCKDRAAFHVFNNGILERLACVDEAEAHVPGTLDATLPLLPSCQTAPGIEEYRCP